MCMPRRSVISDSLQTHGLYPTRLLCPWDSPGKTTGVGCHARFRGLPDPRIKPESLMSPALASGFFTTSTTWEAQKMSLLVIYFIYTLYFVINHCIFPLQYLQHFTPSHFCHPLPTGQELNQHEERTYQERKLFLHGIHMD